MPHFLFESDEGGFSNYGVYNETIVLYTLAFGLCGVLTLQAARVLPIGIVHRRGLQCILQLAGWLYLFVLESTYLYQVNGLLDLIHIVSGITLFLFETAATIWFGYVFARDRSQNVLLVIELVGFVLGLLTLFGILHVLFVAETLTNAAFGMLTIRTVRQAVQRRA